MAKPAQVLTANRLRDGDVVYRRGVAWVEAFDQADVFDAEEAAKAALLEASADVTARLIVNPYLFDVRRDASGVHPAKEREIIRAAGPTVRQDLGKQAHHVPL